MGKRIYATKSTAKPKPKPDLDLSSPSGKKILPY